MRVWEFAKVLIVTVCLFVGFGYPQTSGKISGKVVDEKTGEPLVGVNIVILGTQMGTASDGNGEFFIFNVPPGNYDIEFQMIGYKKVKLEDVIVNVNRTTYLNISMSQSVIEGEEVVVYAKKIEIKKDQTSSVRNITSEEIDKLPIDNMYQIVSLEPGVVGSHFRGGRGDEVSYMVDGITVTESFFHESQTVELNPDIIEEVEVITGTFNAEYGNAMSGVVNIVTKEGNDKFSMSGEVSVGDFLTTHKNIFTGLDNNKVRIKDCRINVSGPLGKFLRYLINFRYYYNMGHLYGINIFNPDDYSDFSNYPISWISEKNGDSSYVPLEDDKETSLFAKFTLKPISSLKLNVIYNYNTSDFQNYNHQFKYNPYGLPTNHEKTNFVALYVNHMLSTNMFYELKLSYNKYKYGNYVFEDPLDSCYVHDFYGRITGQWFSTGGQIKDHTVRTEKKTNVKFDFNWQVNKNHGIKAGFDLNNVFLNNKYANIRNKYEGSSLESIFIIDSLSGKRIYPYYDPEIRSDSSIYTDYYKKNPIQFSAYIQDKMEFESMVVNAGVRFDYFDPNTRYPTNWRNPANQDYFEDESRMSRYPKVKPQYLFSPRLGLSYKMGEYALLRFGYGHFLQIPAYNYFYQNNDFIVTELALVGNPLLKCQKTVQYEIGLWQQLTSNMNLEIVLFYKDFYDLLSSKLIYTYSQIRYGLFCNKDYGNARGLELKYQFRSGMYFVNVNYSLQYSRGVADSPYLAFNRAGQDMDPVNKLIPMSWDQRHTLKVAMGYEGRKSGVTVLMNYNTGTPYTWTPISESPLALINLLPNNQYKPSQFWVDINAYYNLGTIKGTSIRLTLIAYNILDRLNEVFVNSTTGRAYTGIVRPVNLYTYRSDFSTYYDVLHNPGMYGAPRSIRVGLEFNFNK